MNGFGIYVGINYYSTIPTNLIIRYLGYYWLFLGVRCGRYWIFSFNFLPLLLYLFMFQYNVESSSSQMYILEKRGIIAAAERTNNENGLLSSPSTPVAYLFNLWPNMEIRSMHTHILVPDQYSDFVVLLFILLLLSDGSFWCRVVAVDFTYYSFCHDSIAFTMCMVFQCSMCVVWW